MPQARQPDLPAGIRAALLDRQDMNKPQQTNHGTMPPVHPNDVHVDATANEVVFTFSLVTGGGQPNQPQTVQEVAKIAMSWAMVEVLGGTCTKILTQALNFRIQATESTLEELKTLQVKYDEMSRTLAEEEGADGQSAA